MFILVRALVRRHTLLGSILLNIASVSLCKHTPQLVNWFSSNICFYFIINLFIQLFRPKLANTTSELKPAQTKLSDHFL